MYAYNICAYIYVLYIIYTYIIYVCECQKSLGL